MQCGVSLDLIFQMRRKVYVIKYETQNKHSVKIFTDMRNEPTYPRITLHDSPMRKGTTHYQCEREKKVLPRSTHKEPIGSGNQVKSSRTPRDRTFDDVELWAPTAHLSVRLPLGMIGLNSFGAEDRCYAIAERRIRKRQRDLGARETKHPEIEEALGKRYIRRHEQAR